MTGRPFHCDVCHRDLETARSDAETNAESVALWGREIPAEDRAVICDDCFQRFMVWARGQGLVQ